MDTSKEQKVEISKAGKGKVNHVEICNVRVSSVNLKLACQVVDHWVQSRDKTYVCVAPASTIVDCCLDRKYLDIVNQAGMVTPDGMPVVWLGRLKGERQIQRTYGPDLMMALCREGELKGYRHYFYGGTSEVCQLLVEQLKAKFPSLDIVGTFSPSFRSIGAEEPAEIIEKINQANPDILWVGLGSPKQDFWMAQCRGRLNVPVMIGVGAAFDFLSGFKQQAPRWMQKSGLEWLFRLWSEPRRLWKRYLIGNMQFIYFVTKDFFQRKQCPRRIIKAGRQSDETIQ